MNWLEKALIVGGLAALLGTGGYGIYKALERMIHVYRTKSKEEKAFDQSFQQNRTIYKIKYSDLELKIKDGLKDELR